MPAYIIVMTDPELRQAISEWIEKHTEFTVKSFEGIEAEGRMKLGTSGFPAFKLGVEPR